MEFLCNICGATNQVAKLPDRESPSCTACGSNVRWRSLMYVLSMEIFGTAIPLRQFPKLKSICGLGMTDFGPYAERLAQMFDYRNTFYDREPRLDINRPPSSESGRYDFLISSEVFEHVLPPPETAFRNAFDLLKPNGVLILTVPYSIEPTMLEHYPDLHQFGFAQIAGETVLVNRTRAGEFQIFDKLVFHGPGAGRALEMREFNEAELKRILSAAGFSEARVYSENYAPFGIAFEEAWSLPIAARKSQFSFAFQTIRELMQQWPRL